MPILSDFTTVTDGSEFLFNGRVLNVDFHTGGRHNTEALLDIAAFGGYRAGDRNMLFRVRLNGRLLPTISARRWQSGADAFAPDRMNVVIPPDVLRSSGANTLRIEPSYEETRDYGWIGPVICHFHQDT
ncbi:MAG TPA: hypothetical protein VFP76_02630 [Gemmatimonadota bacterium]|nr:hypothetical protein [Gemmatimonadota bacterium]